MFEKRRSRIRLELNLMDVIIIHEVEFKAYATAVVFCVSSFFLVLCLRSSHTKCSKNMTECWPFFYSASDVLTKNVEKTNGMPAVVELKKCVFWPKFAHIFMTFEVWGSLRATLAPRQARG